MRKVLILLLGVAVIASACGRADKKAAAKQAEIERIRMRQDSARRADEERMLELQMRARQDSLAMAIAMSNLEASEPAQRTVSSYYVVVGSFLNKSNANSYLREMRDIFSDAQIVANGKWSMVCVGGRFNSFGAAARTIDDVKSQLGGGGDEEASDEESYDEEGGDEEVMAEEEVADDEEYSEEEDYEDNEEDGGSSGQAWVMGV